MITCPIDNQLIELLSFDGSLDVSNVHRVLGIREHTARYRLKRLIDRGILTYGPVLNPQRAGLDMVDVYFSLRAEVPDAAECVQKALSRSAAVVLLEEVAGRFDFHVRLAARGKAQALRTSQELGSSCGGVLLDKWIATPISSSLFPFKVDGCVRQKPAAFEVDMGGECERVDDTDDRILNYFGSERCGSWRELARSLGLPSSTVTSRLHSLTERKILQKFVYTVDERALGRFPYRILLTTTRTDPAIIGALRQFCASYPTSKSLDVTLGVWDFEVQIHCADPREVSQFTRALHQSLGTTIVRSEVLPVLRTIVQRAWPVKEDTAERNARARAA